MLDRTHRRGLFQSLSARRAWIEMLSTLSSGFSVMSLSARRAWIEIVAAHVGRRKLKSRSPQGERG